MQTSDSSVATRDSYVKAAEALRPLIAEHAERGERERRVPDEVIAEIRAAGLLRLGTPKRFDGAETSFRTMLEVARILSQGDGSTGWVANLQNASSYIVGVMTEQAQSDVWADNPDAAICSCFTPTATSRRDGTDYVVSGKWGWASGSHYADWALQAIPLIDEAGNDQGTGLALIPMSELEIVDTWQVAGMCGTGSNTLVGNDLRIPEYRILPMRDARAGRYLTPFTDEVLYRTPFVSAALLVLAFPLPGMAEAALEVVTSKAPQRSLAHSTYATLSESTGVQLKVAEAAARIDTALLHARRAADLIDEAAVTGVYPDLETRGRIRMDTGWIATQCCAAMDLLVSAYGASAFAQNSPLQRNWRDVNTGSRHGAINPAINAEVFGRVLLGLDPRQISPVI